METIRCIFCLEEKNPSVEHVMPRALGGNLTIRSVCQKCNRDLSHLDQSLTDASLLVLPRLIHQPDASWGRSARMARSEEDPHGLEIKLGHKLASKMKPQLIFKQRENSGEFTVRGSAERPEHYEVLFKVLRKQMKKTGLRGIKILSPIDATDEAGFRIVLNRSDEVVFRPSSRDQVESEFSTMVALLENRLDEIQKTLLEASRLATVNKHEQPGVILGISADFGRNLRAAAKIAYTFLAATYGPEFVLVEKFMPLRQYILTGAGADDSGSLWWNGDLKEKSLGSSRYAVWLNESKGQVFSCDRLGFHSVTITQQADRHILIIDFYNESAFAVDIGDIGIPIPLPYIHEFDFVNRANRVVPTEEVLTRFIQKMVSR